MTRTKRGWKEASGLSLDDLRSLIELKEAESAGLVERRAAIVAELAALDARIGGGRDARRGRKPGKRGPGRPRGSKRGPGRPPKSKRKPLSKRSGGGRRRGRKPGPKGQSELHGLIRGAMNGASEPMKATAIAKKVVDSGYKTKSKVFHLIVGQRLAEMKDVKRPERGLYALA